MPRDEEVDGALDVGGEPPGRNLEEGHRLARTVYHTVQRVTKTRLSQNRRVEAVRQLTQLVQHLTYPRETAHEGGPVAVVDDVLECRVDGRPEREDVLLRAVVQVSFQATPFGVGVLHQPSPRCGELGGLASLLAEQPAVLECEASGAAHGVRETGCVGPLRGVMHSRHDPVHADELGCRSCVGGRYGAAVWPDLEPTVEEVADRESRVLESCRENCLDVCRLLGRPGQLAHPCSFLEHLTKMNYEAFPVTYKTRSELQAPGCAETEEP